MSLLAYLKAQLQFKLSEWQVLDPATKQWYKDAARQEMTVLGIAINEDAAVSGR